MEQLLDLLARVKSSADAAALAALTAALTSPTSPLPPTRLASLLIAAILEPLQEQQKHLSPPLARALAAALSAAPLADVSASLHALLAADATTIFAENSQQEDEESGGVALLRVAASRCEAPKLLAQLIQRAVFAESARAVGVAAKALRKALANARTRVELFLSVVAEPTLFSSSSSSSSTDANDSSDSVRVTLLRLVLADVAHDARFLSLLSTPKSIPHLLFDALVHTSTSRSLPAQAALLQLAPALFSCVVEPALERQCAPRPVAAASEFSDACAARNAVRFAPSSAAMVNVVKELVRAALRTLAALPGDDVASLDRCVDAVAGVLRRVALTGIYLPNGALDPLIDDAAAAVLRSAASLDCKGDFFAVLLGFNVRFVLARRRALLALLWAAPPAARSRAVPRGATLAAFRAYEEGFVGHAKALLGTAELDAARTGAAGLLTALFESSARARQLPDVLADTLHCFETVTSGGANDLFGAEWLDTVVRLYRAAAPAQVTQILGDTAAALRKSAALALDGAKLSKAAAPGYALAWSLFARVVVGAVHIAATRRHELHADLAALWHDWLAPALAAASTTQRTAAHIALASVCVQLASALERCEILLESGGGDEADIEAANEVAAGGAEVPRSLAVDVLTALLRSPIVAQLTSELATSNERNVDIASALLDLWAQLTRVAPELEGEVDVRACLDVGHEPLWRVAIHHVGALARRRDAGALFELLVDAALPAPRAADKRSKKRGGSASASPACAKALSDYYVFQLASVREPLGAALVARLVRAVGSDEELSAVARTVRKLGEARSRDDVVAVLAKSGGDAQAEGDASTAGDVVTMLATLTRVPALFWEPLLALRIAAIAVCVCRQYPAHAAARALLAALPVAAVCDVIEVPPLAGVLSSEGGVLTSDTALMSRLCVQLCRRVRHEETRDSSVAVLAAFRPLFERGDAVGLGAVHCLLAAVHAASKSHARAALRELVTELAAGVVVRSVESAPRAATAELCRAMAAALLCFDVGSAVEGKDTLPMPASLLEAAATLVARLNEGGESDVDASAVVELSLASIRCTAPSGANKQISPAAERAIELLCSATYEQEQLQPILRSNTMRPVVRQLVRALARAIGNQRSSVAATEKAVQFLTDLVFDLGYMNRNKVLFGGLKNELLAALSAACSELVQQRHTAAAATPLRCFEALVNDDRLVLTTVHVASIVRATNQVASVSTLPLATLECACRVALGVLRRRDAWTRAASDTTLLLVRSLMARTFEANASPAPGSGAAVLAVSDVFSRVMGQLATPDNRGAFSLTIARLGSDYVTWLERVAVANVESRVLLTRGMFYILDVCNKPQMQDVFAGVASSAGKQLFKQLAEDYERTHKHKGVV